MYRVSKIIYRLMSVWKFFILKNYENDLDIYIRIKCICCFKECKIIVYVIYSKNWMLIF